MLAQIYADRLRQTLQDVIDHPAHWKQSSWHCGTTHCFAGFAELRLSSEDLEVALARETNWANTIKIDASYFGLSEDGWLTLIHWNNLDQLSFFVDNLIENDGSIKITRCPISLSKTYLIYADLSYADLRGADLSYADLRGADLSYADLRGADLSYADLRRADLSYTDLSGVDLSYADLRRANLSYADLSNAYLVKADLSNAVCNYADFTNTQLRDATLTNVDFGTIN